jgi:uncharacterized protein (UPF0333 family)
MKRLNQSGSLHLGLLLAVVVVAAVFAVGFRVMNNSKSSDDTTTAASYPSSIQSKADLTQTSRALDQTGSQIDSNLNDSSLDSDINSML